MTADLNKLDLLSLEDASKVSGYTADRLLMLAETDMIDLLIFVQYNELFPDIKAWELPYDEPPDSGCYLAIPPNRAGELRRDGRTGTDIFFLPRNQYPCPALKEFFVSRTSNIPEPGDKISCCNTTTLIFGPENTHIYRDSLIKLNPKDQNSNDQQHQQTTGSGQARQQVEEKSFPIPPGTEWYDIRIHFVDTANVEITIGKGRKYERTYKTLGFLNKKTKRWQQGWMHLLLMAVYRGKLPNIKEVKDITPKHVSRLGKELKRLFPGIDGNPFKTYNKEQGWEPKISLSHSDKISDQYHR